MDNWKAHKQNRLDERSGRFVFTRMGYLLPNTRKPMHQTLLVALSLLLAVSLLVTLGERLRISTPIFLVLCGLAISLIPGIPLVSVDPDLIFLLFLPPLLYEAAWFTSWR